MKKFLPFLLTLFIYSIISANLYGQNAIIKAFPSLLRDNNFEEISKNLSSEAEITINGNEKVGKTAFITSLKTFMSSNPYQGFEYKHHGSSGSVVFAIGQYTSNKGNSFRFMVKTEGDAIEEIDIKNQ